MPGQWTVIPIGDVEPPRWRGRTAGQTVDLTSNSATIWLADREPQQGMFPLAGDEVKTEALIEAYGLTV